MDYSVKEVNGRTIEDISVPDEMRHWLFLETRDIQSSYIRDSKWWWDSHEGGDDFVLFYFLDPTVALKFKLTWGSGSGLSA